VSKGFIILAQNTKTVDYIQQAYALALSIKHSQQEKSISLITNDIVPKKYQALFDQIIPIPWEDTDSRFRAENRWKIYHVTPYDETIVLDTDMLLLEDVADWWSYCNNYDIKFCSRVKNYKLDTIVDTFHRKTFISNNLTNPYFGLHYFKKNQAAFEFYKILEFVITHWEFCRGTFAPLDPQEWLSMDLAAAIAIEIAGIQDTAVDKINPMEFVHMKTPIQGWQPIPASWQDTVPFLLNKKGELIVGNIKQDKLFHYVEKNFITDDIINKLEELVNAS
jgi:hypothetical protein